MARPIPIFVFGNPFTALDHQGQPCGVFPFDPEHAAGSRRWIGASIDQAASKARTTAEALKGSQAHAPLRVSAKGITIVEAVAIRHRPVFAFDLTPQPIPFPATKHYRDGVRDGSLFPVDLASAKALGVAAKDFRDPAELFAEARAYAIQHWQDQHGEPPPIDEWPASLQPVIEAPAAPVASEPGVAPAAPPIQAIPVELPELAPPPPRPGLVKLDAPQALPSKDGDQ